MFIQIMQGKCMRPDEMHALADEWREQIAPHASGWLGGTYGFTDDNQFVGVVRFDSPESANANSARPEQSAWAERMAACFDGPIEYHDCDDVEMFLDGGSDQAGFVQVIRGKVDDPSRLKAGLADTSMMHQMRPEIIGGTLAVEPDGTFTETIAFTDEQSARVGEKMEPPDDVRRELEYAMRGATFYDLHHPWFQSRD